MRYRLIVRVGLMLALLTSLSCATAEPPPPGIGVVIDQTRIDVARDIMSIRVVNGGADPVKVTQARYADDRLAGELLWEGERTVPAGRERDLRVEVPQVACDEPEHRSPTAELTFITTGGAEVVHAYPVTDPFAFVDRIHTDGCFDRLVSGHGQVRLGELMTEGTGADEVAVIDLQVTNTDADLLAIESVESTVILRPEAASLVWEAVAVAGPGEQASAQLRIIPARCDVHALAEDKVGTRFLIDTEITVDGDRQTGTITRWASPQHKHALFDYVRRWCGMG